MKRKSRLKGWFLECLLFAGYVFATLYNPVTFLSFHKLFNLGAQLKFILPGKAD